MITVQLCALTYGLGTFKEVIIFKWQSKCGELVQL